MTEKCLCYNQKRKFFALSFTLWWCRNIKEKLWGWLSLLAGRILELDMMSEPNLRHFPARTRPPHTCQSDFREDFWISDLELFCEILWKKPKIIISWKKHQRGKLKIHKKSSIRGITEHCRLKNGCGITKNVRI